MTPEELGPELLRLRERGELTREKYSALVTQATDVETERRILGELRRVANAVGFAAGMLSCLRDERFRERLEELLTIKIEELEGILTTCRFKTSHSAGDTPS